MGMPAEPQNQGYVNPTATTSTVLPNYVVGTGGSGNVSNPQFFTAEDIEKARREERDKLYGRISKTDEKFKSLEDEVASLRQITKEREAAEAAARQAAEEALRAQQQEELSAKQLIEQREAEWKQRFEEIERKREKDRMIYERDQEFLRLKNYIERRAREEMANETIGDELIDFITGNNEAEVEQSIIMLREKTERILNGVREGQQQSRAAMPGVSASGQPPMGGPLDNLSGQTKQLTDEDIKSIPMSDWHEFRRRIGLSNTDSNQGLYGP
jgi:DNA repair exonuclease SbcCD ATPase subunit